LGLPRGLFDYSVADPILIPPSHQHGHIAKIAYLLHGHVPHDEASRLVPDRAVERLQFGLPDRGFVFCCFNAAYKFNPDVFWSWMRPLAAIDGSVLWLAEVNATAEANLRKLAAAA
jgi:predicted O-linked N-acetylglucosamine transferase (SPINDLY family)